MAKVEKKKVSRVKTKKKIWHKILAPAGFGKKEIGEAYLGSAEQAKGRPLRINLKDLTGSMRDQNVYISFKICKWQGTVLETTTTGYELTPQFVKRMVRKNCNRLDDYFVLTTKDGKSVIVKTLMLTLHKIPRSTRTSLRKQLNLILKEEVGRNTFESLISQLVGNKIQYPAKKKLAKIYPMKEVAIRKIILVGGAVKENLKSKEVVNAETVAMSEENRSEDVSNSSQKSSEEKASA
jgi:small subunit ribosomal protein S3Ae